MKAVIQRVSEASVSIDKQAKISHRAGVLDLAGNC